MSEVIPDVSPVSPKGFQNNPAFRRVSHINKNAILLEDLTYISGTGEVIVVPLGFETDWASIPWIFWNIPGFDSDGPAAIPAILHDFLYKLRGGDPYGKNRRQCDDLFLEAVQLVGVTWAHRQIIYRMVRAWGWAYSMNPKWEK